MSDSESSSSNIMDWEEILPAPLMSVTSTSKAPLEITIRAPAHIPSQSELKKEKSQSDALARAIRLQSHRIHTIALLANASIRNRWLNDTLLHARLLSLTPLPIITSFSMITKRNQPEKSLRGRQFEAALLRLTEWWSEVFRVDPEEGIRHCPYQNAMLQPTLKGTAKGSRRTQDGEGEIIKSEKSLMKHALMMKGSPDVSAQLFTAQCRSLGLPARLVVSLQPVLWRREKTPKEAAVDKAIQKMRKRMKEDEERVQEASVIAATARNISTSKGKAKAKATSSDDNESEMEEFTPSLMVANGKGPEGATLGTYGSVPQASSGSHRSVSLRKPRPQGRTLGASISKIPVARKKDSPPVFWTEVYSRPDGRWLAVNAIKPSVNNLRAFEPVPGDRYNHMMYVVAFEEDGFVRDVTPRYSKSFLTRIIKERRTTEGKQDWWALVLSFLTREYRLNRDDVEDAEFENLQIIEGMPKSIGAFKNHPLYVLERHLRQDEVIHPHTQVGKFRGEPVFLCVNVTPLKSAENWLRTAGRSIRPGAQPLKMGKVRAATLNKQRALEMAMAENNLAGEAGSSTTTMMQGLYAEWQTEVYIPDPVINGKVPKNSFGNIDLYTPSMLPDGGAHVPYKGTAKIARQLNIDFAEAVTSFEFKHRKAYPVMNGVVVPLEREAELIEAYEASAAAAEEKERRKKEERIAKNWTRLIQGLRIRDRLKLQYAKGSVTIPIPAVESDEEAGGFLEGDTGIIATSSRQPDALASRVSRYDLPALVNSRMPDPFPNPRIIHQPSGDENDSDKEAIGPFASTSVSTRYSSAYRNLSQTGMAAASGNRASGNGHVSPKTMTQFAESRAVANSSGKETLSECSTESLPHGIELPENAGTGPRVSNVSEHSPPVGRLKASRKRHRKVDAGTNSDVVSDNEFGADIVEPRLSLRRISDRTVIRTAPVTKSDRVLRTRPSKVLYDL